MEKRILQWASLLGFLAVVLGAFGAHTLEQFLSPERLETFDVGVEYHFIHVLAMILCAILYRQFQIKGFARAAWFFLVGIFCFSGSIYLLACRELIALPISWLGPVTPLGGTLFIIGWGILFVSSIKISN